MTNEVQRFVTREEIEYGEDHLYSPPNHGSACGQCGVNWSRLLSERDEALRKCAAYREVAGQVAHKHCMDNPCLCSSKVDAEAARILEKKP